MSKVKIEIEPVNTGGDVCMFRGWVMAEKDIEIRLYSLANRTSPKELSYNKEQRPDIIWVYPEAKELVPGFNFTLPRSDFEKILPIEVRVTTDDGETHTLTYKKYTYYKRRVMDSPGKTGGFLRFLRGIYRHNLNKLEAEGSFAAHYGEQSARDYSIFLKENELKKDELNSQRQKYSSYIDSKTKLPAFHFVTAVYKTDPDYLNELISSLKSQTYGNWDIYFAECSVDEGVESPEGRTLRDIIRSEAKKDERIHLIEAADNNGISENTNLAIRQVIEAVSKKDTDHFIAFADHDDLLSPDAVCENTEAVLKNKNISFLYSDEDKIDDSANRFDPNFKPDFSPDYLYSINYICHLVCVRLDLVKKAGFLDKSFDGAQDYDYVLRTTELLSGDKKKIHHIPRVLYHWRSHPASTASNPSSKKYAFVAGANALNAHFKRCGIDAEASDQGGFYYVDYHVQNEPMISILIPNMDHISDLDKCVKSILKQSYSNFEIIIIENNSREENTFKYYDSLTDSRIHVVKYETDVFNFSAINNYGAKFARGDYLLLLNNDTEMIKDDVLYQLIGVGQRPDVGAVGAKLLYGDDTIQHAGVVIGYGGIAGHAFHSLDSGWPGYKFRIMCSNNYSAVTAACLLVRRSVFDEVDGLFEGLDVAFNDVDFCLKIIDAGYHIVYRPQVALYHYESKSRGYEDNTNKLERFDKEKKLVRERWPDVFNNPDPYYNPNLSLLRDDFSLNLKYDIYKEEV